MQGLGAPELAQDPRFSSVQSRARHPKEIEPCSSRYLPGTPRRAGARLHNADAPVGKVDLKSQVIDDPQVVHNGTLTESITVRSVEFASLELPRCFEIRIHQRCGEHLILASMASRCCGNRVRRGTHWRPETGRCSHGLGRAGFNDSRIYALPANHIMTFFWVEFFSRSRCRPLCLPHELGSIANKRTGRQRCETLGPHES